MLALVKWAYRLGVRNERHRIASYLQSVKANSFNHLDAIEREVGIVRDRDYSDTKKQAEIDRLRKKQAVDQALIDIISELFRGEDKYERGASVMFPDEEEL